jgi:hypothetical protein
MTDDNTHLPAQTIKDLEVNHTYLIRYGLSDIVSSITILLITDKAYHVRWNRGQDSNDTWELKEKLYNDYSLIEDISDFVIDKPFLYNYEITYTGNSKVKYVQCHVCKGFGTIPDNNLTTGTKSCPLCHGSKLIVGEITTE